MKKKKWIFLFLLIPASIHLYFEVYLLSTLIVAVFSNKDTLITFNSDYNISFASPSIKENGVDIIGQIEEITNEQYKQNNFNEACNGNGVIFPENVNNVSAKCFAFSENHNQHFRSEIYLESEFFDSNSYFDEIQRLQLLEGKHSKKPIYSSDLFALPSYVATYNVDACYEYALFDEDNLKIIYIYLSSFDTYENIVFNIDYAPCRILKGSDFPRWAIKDGSYSIYGEETINEKE